MRLLIIGLIVLIIGLAGVYGAGSSLPVEMTTIRGAQFRADMDRVWHTITDYAQAAEWNPDVVSVKAIPDPENNEETLWHLIDAQDNYMILRVSTPIPKKLQRSEIVETDLPFTGVWEFEVTPNEDGTFVKLIEKSRIPNPFVRFATYYIVGNDYGITRYFNAMADHFVEEIEIQELAH